mmetsp:Transcript_22108/g.40547  ORF Transcript_22108/g.40547 Transcript_22108/m.40547 type:complete len:201 (+) Transcript_22108:1094-1696(+)
MSNASKKRRNTSSRGKTVFDVIYASSTASMKQRQMMHRPKVNGNANIGTLSNISGCQTEDYITNDMDPSSTDWIEQGTISNNITYQTKGNVTSGKDSPSIDWIEQMAATTKHKFNEQRLYYESQLQAQREKNHEQGRENKRLRNELWNAKSVEKEKDAQTISSMKEEIEALKLELSEEKESNKTKDAGIENRKESLRSLL